MTKPARMEQLRDAVQRLKPERSHLASDLVAALTFAVVNVPQAMGHALLATVNPVLGIFTLMVAVPVGAIFNSSVFMNVSTTAALSVAAGVVLVEFPAGQRAGGAGRAGAAGGRDPVAGRPVPAGLPDPFRLQRGDDRLSQRRRRADHPGPVERPDGLPEQLLEPRGPGAGPAAAHRPDRPAGHHHRRVHAGADRGAAVAQGLAALRLHHRHRRGDRRCWPC